MSKTVLIGSQWGDEVKGKIIDRLCSLGIDQPRETQLTMITICNYALKPENHQGNAKQGEGV